MEQELTLAQCKSTFRIFQPCRIGWAPEEWNEGQCVPSRDTSGEVIEGAEWCNFEQVPLCEIFSIETGEKLKVVNRHYCDANLGLFKLHTVINSEKCQMESGVSCTNNGFKVTISQTRRVTTLGSEEMEKFSLAGTARVHRTVKFGPEHALTQMPSRV